MSKVISPVLFEIKVHFDALGIPSLIVGATARDLIAEQYGLSRAERLTNDVDFAIFLEDWEKLERLRERFREDANISFPSDPNTKVRYYYNKVPFDLVPFGPVAREHVVSWPPLYETVMTILGYQEAFDAAIEVIVDETPVRIVCPEILVALKLIAWDENRSRKKDISDIGYLMDHYERMNPKAYALALDHHIDVLEEFEFEAHLAAIMVMGIEIAKIAAPETKERLVRILSQLETIDEILKVAVKSDAFGEESQQSQSTLWRNRLRALSRGLQAAS